MTVGAVAAAGAGAVGEDVREALRSALAAAAEPEEGGHAEVFRRLGRAFVGLGHKGQAPEARVDSARKEEAWAVASEVLDCLELGLWLEELLSSGGRRKTGRLAGADGGLALQWLVRGCAPKPAASPSGKPPSGKRANLDFLAHTAPNAALSVAECAAEVLLHCRLAADAALQDGGARAAAKQADVADTASGAAAEAARLLAQISDKVAEAARSRLAERAAKAGKEPGGLAALREAAAAADGARDAVGKAISDFLEAQAEAADAPRTFAEEGDAGAVALRGAVSRLALSADGLAGACLDAAEVAASALAAVRGFDQDLKEREEMVAAALERGQKDYNMILYYCYYYYYYYYHYHYVYDSNSNTVIHIYIYIYI